MFKKIIPILPQIIASLFLTGFMVYGAWSGPTALPPNNNADAPINVGLTGQTNKAICKLMP